MKKFPEPFLFKPKNPHKYVGDVNKIVCRSGIEKRYFKFFDEEPSILKYSSEEVIVPYVHPLDKKVHRYFPDFIIQVMNKDGQKKMYMVEIKPTSDTIKPVRGKKRVKTFLTETLTWEINQAKWEAARKYCEKRNMKFMVLTEQHIKHKW